MNDFKGIFIEQALTDYMQELQRRIREIARRTNIGVSGAGMASITYNVLKSDNASGIATMTFAEYLRFVDMGVGRGHPLGKTTSKVISLQAQNKIGLTQVRDTGRKPKTYLYSKQYMGLVTYLQNKLLYGFTEETIAAIKSELLKANVNAA